MKTPPPTRAATITTWMIALPAPCRFAITASVEAGGSSNCAAYVNRSHEGTPTSSALSNPRAAKRRCAEAVPIHDRARVTTSLAGAAVAVACAADDACAAAYDDGGRLADARAVTM